MVGIRITCNHSIHEDLVTKMCRNSCGTRVCGFCESSFYYDQNGNITNGHNPQCGILMCPVCKTPRSSGNHNECTKIMGSYEYKVPEKWREFFPKTQSD